MHVIIIILLLCILSRMGTASRGHRWHRERRAMTWGDVGIALVSLPVVVILWCLIAPHIVQILAVGGIALGML